MAKRRRRRKVRNEEPEIPIWTIVIGIILIVFFIGFIIDEATKAIKKLVSNEGVKVEEKQIESETTKEELLNQKRERLSIVDKTLNDLLRKKVEISLLENRIILRVRMLTAFLIILGNSIYTYFFNWPMKLTTFLDFNEIIILSYSFLAFITYGSPTNFINGLKESVASYLKSKNIDTLEEIETLTTEHDTLIKEISLLELNL